MGEITQVCFAPFIGELGWCLSRWHGYARYRRFTEFRNLRSIAIDYDWRYPIYADFIDEFIPLPKWVSELGWEQDCYELVPPDAHPGAVTPPDIYARILSDCTKLYDPETTWTVRPPRGCNFFIQFKCKQMWKPLEASEQAQAFADSLLYTRPGDIVLVSARGRKRSADRNIPETTWNRLVDLLVWNGFTVAITGTPHSSFLADKVGRNIVNVINRTGVDGLDILFALMKRAKFSITSQSGPTHVSLQCETPAYIVGHEAQRHSVDENYLNTPAMFRSVPNNIYAMLSAEKMIEDVMTFNNQLTRAQQVVDSAYSSCHLQDRETMHLLQREEANFYKIDIDWQRQEILNAM